MASIESLVNYFDGYTCRKPEYLMDKWKGDTNEDEFSWIFRGYRRVQ